MTQNGIDIDARLTAGIIFARAQILSEKSGGLYMRVTGNKVAIVGAGQVGSTTAFALLDSGLVSDLALIDINTVKAGGEALDLAHGIPLCPPADVVCGDYDACTGADIVVISAGVNQKKGESRIDLTRRNVAVFRDVVPRIAHSAPDAILLVATNPVDILTFEALRLSRFERERVIGSGTVLDTSRLRYLLSRHTGVDARNVHTYVLGEHGDSELPVWSLTRIAGMTMDQFCENCPGCQGRLSQIARDEFDEQVRHVAYTIIEKKGATYYAVALAIRRIVEAILRDERSILTVSTLLQGQYGLENVCLSLPAIVGARGAERAMQVPLDMQELDALRMSHKILSGILNELYDE